MTKVDFYILKDGPLGSRYKTACRIAEKAHKLGHQVHIHTSSEAESRKLDELLWIFQDRSFVPHEAEPHCSGDCAVTIGHGWTPEHSNVLINLAAEVPAFFSRFERVSEIIDQQPETRNSGRARYKFYRDRGYELSHHEIHSR